MGKEGEFREFLADQQINLVRDRIEVLQLNTGRRCNQICRHCHVDAGPHRTEEMSLDTVHAVLAVQEKFLFPVVDITGGAPELHSQFRPLIQGMRRLGTRRLIDRCNLTVFFEKGQDDTPAFLAGNRVEITASLPCYLKENVDRQRGEGVFDKSIRALKILNNLGYGAPDGDLILNLVYNPGGGTIPPSQTALESDYRHQLGERYGVCFNKLLCLANMPIARFARELDHQGQRESYLRKLRAHFNPEAARNAMCRTTLSVGYDGRLYDCDFNQQLGIPLGGKGAPHISDLLETPCEPQIATANHCFVCTAGEGSGCGGATTPKAAVS